MDCSGEAGRTRQAATTYRVRTVVHTDRLKSPIGRVEFTAHLSAEDGISPGAIFRDENRRLMVQDVPPARSRSGEILAEGSP